MTTEQAIKIVACFMLRNMELPKWDDFPEIGLHDWERIDAACRQIIRSVAPQVKGQEFAAAYALLESRANKPEE